MRRLLYQVHDVVASVDMSVPLCKKICCFLMQPKRHTLEKFAGR